MGQQAHKAFAERVQAKPGWRSEVGVSDRLTRKTYRVDAVAPNNRPVELKPNTPSGRRAGSARVKEVQPLFPRKGRVVYHNNVPKPKPLGARVRGH
jgi:hypothetical protein